MKTKNWYKGLTATAITLAMAGAALTVPAMAIDYDLNYGDVHVGTNDDGSVWSGQTQDGENYFHYEQAGNNGEYEFISGKYQHTNSDGQTDTEINISQGFVDSMTDNDTETVPDDGAEFDQVAVPDAGSETTGNTVTVSGDLTGKDTDETNDVDITISDVNVDIEGKKDFITVGKDTTADITIENSDVQTNGSILDIDTGSDVTLNLDGETHESEDGTITGGANDFTSFNGIDISGSDLTINHDGENNFTGIDASINENNRFEYTGIYMTGGSSVDIYGADADAELTISGYQNNVAVNSKDKTNLNISTGTVNLVSAKGNGSGWAGNGIFVTGNNGDVNISVTGEEVTKETDEVKQYDTHLNIDNNDESGIYYANNQGSANNTLAVTNAEFSASNNGWVGIYLETSHASNQYTFDNSRAHINSNGSNGITGQGAVMYIDHGAEVHVDYNKGIGTNTTSAFVNRGSYFSVSNNASHGFTNGALNILSSTADFNNNGYRGLNISATFPYYESSIIQDSTVHADGNGQSGIYFQQGAEITNSTVTALNNGSVGTSASHRAGILMYKNSLIQDSTLMVDGSDNGIVLYDESGHSGIMKVTGSSVLAVNGSVWDFYDDWNKLGYTGRDFITSGSLQADLDAMYGYYILNDPSLEGKTGLELFLAIAAKYNKGEGVNAIVTGAPAGSVVAGSANDTQYTGPVNENGTLLFRFDLNGEIDKGAAMKNNGDGTYTFTYTDPNTGKVVEYTFRYNIDGEDLTGTGNNAYVWTPVTIIHYDPLNNDLSGSQIGTAQNNGDNTAMDVTIFGTTINLGEKDMPSYETKVDTQVTTTTGADGSIITTTTTTTSTYGWWVHVDEEGKLQVITPPDDNASQEEWDAFYALLNYQVTEETNLLELCGGDTKLAESITVYGMWTTTTEQHVETTPGEPEIPDYPEIPEYPELPDYDPPEVDIDDPDVPLVEEPEEPEEPEQPTEEIDDEETPLTPSIPDEVIDDIIAEIEDEVTPLTSVPQTGAEMPAATAALPAGVLALAVSAVVRRIRRKD